MNEIRELDNKLTDILDTETNVLSKGMQVRKDSEQRLLRIVEDKSAVVKGELIKESRSRATAIEQLSRSLDVDIPKLHDLLREESRERQTIDQGIRSKTNEQIARISNLIAAEKRKREENEQGVLDMLQEVMNRIKLDIDEEKKMRETTEGRLITLLEETCNKIDVVGVSKTSRINGAESN